MPKLPFLWLNVHLKFRVMRAPLLDFLASVDAGGTKK